MTSPNRSGRTRDPRRRQFTLLGIALLGFLSCGWAFAADRDALSDYLFIPANDYEFSAGSYSLMEMGEPWTHEDNLLSICPDAIARVYNGLIYVIERAGCDNILVLDPHDDFSVVLQFSTGPGSNPQDICFVSSSRAFITRYDTAELWEVNPLTGDHTDTIDLSVLADGDGWPEMMGMAIYEDRLYVSLQRLDRDYYWTPVFPSYLAVIDLATNTLIDQDANSPGLQGAELLATHPSTLLLQDPLSQHIYVGETGSYGVQDGGIEAFDPATGQSLGFVVTESDLGGDLNVWTSADMMRGFAVVLSPSYTTSVVAFDLQTGSSLGTVTSSDEYDYVALAVDPSYREVYVADANYTQPGIHVFDSETFDPLSGLIDIGLYPRWILPMHGPASDIGPTPDDERGARVRGQSPGVLEAWPQPAWGSVEVAFTGLGSQIVDLSILDAQGRLVKAVAHDLSGPLRQAFRWDGTREDGRPAPGGAYFVRASGGDGQITRGIRLLR